MREHQRSSLQVERSLVASPFTRMYRAVVMRSMDESCGDCNFLQSQPTSHPASLTLSHSRKHTRLFLCTTPRRYLEKVNQQHDTPGSRLCSDLRQTTRLDLRPNTRGSQGGSERREMSYIQIKVSAWLTDKGIMIRAGCFFDTRDQFEFAIAVKHGKNMYAQEYIAALVLIDMHAQLWTPAVETIEATKTEEVVA